MGRDEGAAHGDFQGSKTILYEATMEDTCHYTFVQNHRMYTRSECSYKPWTSGDNAVVNVGSVTNESPWGEMLRAGEALRCGGRDLWEISLPSAQVCSKPKDPKSKSLF